MKVKDAMSKQVECVLARSTLAEAARKMQERDVGFLPVTEDGRTVGLVTDRDLTLRGVAAGKDPTTASVAELLTPDIVWCEQDDDLEDAARLMRERGVRRLLVHGGEHELAGVISLGDLCRHDGRAAQGVLSSLAEAPPTL